MTFATQDFKLLYNLEPMILTGVNEERPTPFSFQGPVCNICRNLLA